MLEWGWREQARRLGARAQYRGEGQLSVILLATIEASASAFYALNHGRIGTTEIDMLLASSESSCGEESRVLHYRVTEERDGQEERVLEHLAGWASSAIVKMHTPKKRRDGTQPAPQGEAAELLTVIAELSRAPDTSCAALQYPGGYDMTAAVERVAGKLTRASLLGVEVVRRVDRLGRGLCFGRVLHIRSFLLARLQILDDSELESIWNKGTAHVAVAQEIKDKVFVEFVSQFLNSFFNSVRLSLLRMIDDTPGMEGARVNVALRTSMLVLCRVKKEPKAK